MSYSLHLLHSLSNQGYFGLQISKLGLVTSATLSYSSYMAVRHINLTNVSIWQVAKQRIKAPGPLVVHLQVYSVYRWCIKHAGTFTSASCICGNVHVYCSNLYFDQAYSHDPVTFLILSFHWNGKIVLDFLVRSHIYIKIVNIPVYMSGKC